MLKVNLNNPQVNEDQEDGYIRISSEYSSMSRRGLSLLLFIGVGIGALLLYFQTDAEVFTLLFAVFLIALGIGFLFIPAWTLLIDLKNRELVVEKRSLQSLFKPIAQRFNFNAIYSVEENSDALGLSQIITLKGPNLEIAATFMQKHLKKASHVLKLFEDTFEDRLGEQISLEEVAQEKPQFNWWRFRLGALFSIVVGLILVLIWAAAERFFGIDLGILMYAIGVFVGLAILFASGGVNDNRYTVLAVGMTALSIALMAIYLFFTPSSPYISTGSGFQIFLLIAVSASFAWSIVRRKNQFMQKRSHVLNEGNQLVLSMVASFLILVLVFGFYAMTDFAVPQDISAKQAFDNGMILMSQDNPEGAIGAFEDALTKKPDYVEAQVQIGLAYIELDEYSKAETELQNALDLDPNNGLAYFGLGRLAIQAENYGEARDSLSTALDLGISPINEALALSLRGLAHTVLNERDLAFDDFDLSIAKAEDIDEDDLTARMYTLRALGYLSFDQSGLAIEDLKIALELAEDEALITQINSLLSEIGENS